MLSEIADVSLFWSRKEVVVLRGIIGFLLIERKVIAEFPKLLNDDMVDWVFESF